MANETYTFKMQPTFKRYYNADSLYGVYIFKTSEPLPHLDKDDFGSQEYVGTLAGKMQQLTEGMEYEVEAKLVQNSKYKQWQYDPIRIVVPKPSSLDNQRTFLNAIITERQTDILLSAYPNIVQDIIDDKDIDLSLTKGIKQTTFNLIREKVTENYIIADILSMLQPLGITIKMIKKLTDNEPNPILLKFKLKQNPYILTQINGLGFKRVDDLALKLNPDLKLSEERVKCFISYYLNEVGESDGHTWITVNKLNSEVKDTIPECYDIYQNFMKSEKENPKLLMIDETRVGLLKNYKIELEIFNRLKTLNESQCLIEDIDIEKAIKDTENKLGFTLTDEQKDAVRSIKDNNVIVITAPAGSGKTIVTNAILSIYQNKTDISMCALSAKAAQRMKEVTGFDAMTIHRLLGVTPDGFMHNEYNTLPSEVIVVDEASMINGGIFLSLIKAIKPGSKFVIVFDFAQLPPIGAGNIASDLLTNGLVKINKFTKIHRQAEKSGILVDANKIRQGQNPLSKPESLVIHGELNDMFYKFRDSRESIQKLAINAYIKSLEEVSIDDIVIITPRKKDCINSTKEINEQIQDLLLPNEQTVIKRGNQVFKLGAKVIQKVNNYELGVVNGEIGYMCDISKEHFSIRFSDDKTVEYTRDGIADIELAYALTVHSSQGSQWHTVICIIDANSWVLLDSTLLYTAITRAAKRCMLVAEPNAYIQCIRNNKAKIRQTYLKTFENN